MALKVGDPAPDFKLTSATGEAQGEVELSKLRGKNVVLAFYPLDFTPVCQSELGAFQADLAKFPMPTPKWWESVRTRCSPTWLSRSIWADCSSPGWPRTAGLMRKWQLRTAFSPPTKHPVPFINDRAVFIVDKDGKIAWSKIYELREQPENDEILAELKKLN